MRLQEPTAWVVYRLPLNKLGVEMNAMCSQDEWEALEREHPGQHVLVRGRIASETEAEKLVRSLIEPDLSKTKRKR
jgi:hypothetical protein